MIFSQDFVEFDFEQINEVKNLESYLNEIKKILQSSIFKSIEEIEKLEKKIEYLLKIKYGADVKVKIKFYKSFEEIKVKQVEVYFNNKKIF